MTSRAQRRRDKRMREVVRLHAKGWSLRQIAAYLDVHHSTVKDDLDRWKELSDSGVGNQTEIVGNPTPESDTKNNIIPIRRVSDGRL